MDIFWVTAFIDLPPENHEAGLSFWSAATGTTLSPTRGDDDEFATFVPEQGDPHLAIQRIGDGPGRIHLDLHVPSVADAAAVAERLGAVPMSGQADDGGFVTMTSPGGLVFCFVDHPFATLSPPIDTPVPNRTDQVSIDVPAPLFDREVEFWARLTGWTKVPSRLDEFIALERPPGIPIRFLLQRLGDEDGAVRAHLDLACGDGVEAVAESHVALGAELVARFEYWTTLRDPAGRLYCLTRRDPVGGSLA